MTTEPTDNWEKRFDDSRKNKWRYLDVGNEHTKQIKDFIRNELTSQKERILAALPEEVERVKDETEGERIRCIYWNVCLKEVKKVITNTN